MDTYLRSYLTVTEGYWAFTVTDGAIRMLVVLYFHALGYSPFEVAMLFLFYEFFGVVTNLVGGWLAARLIKGHGLGLWGNDLRRAALARRGYVERAVVCARNREEAEQRYFDTAAPGAA